MLTRSLTQALAIGFLTVMEGGKRIKLNIFCNILLVLQEYVY